jgi:hypothetical protein
MNSINRFDELRIIEKSGKSREMTIEGFELLRLND